MSEETIQPKNIHEAILRVMENVGYVQKKKGVNLSYTFAGEAALIEAIRPYMVEFGVYCYVVGVSDEVFESYKTAKGAEMNMARLKSTVRFVHAPSGTFIDVQARGQGADSGDKSDNKASTGAYKYALRQTFCIETGDDPDEQSSSEQQKASSSSGQSSGSSQTSAKPVTQPKPQWYTVALTAVKEKSSVWDKTLGETAHGGAFIKSILEHNIGEGQWYKTKADFIAAVQKYTGYKTPEEMRWIDAEHLVRIATNERILVGEPVAKIVYHGILTDTEWAQIGELSGMVGSRLVSTPEMRDDLILWLKGLELAGSDNRDYPTIAANLKKIMEPK